MALSYASIHFLQASVFCSKSLICYTVKNTQLDLQ